MLWEETGFAGVRRSRLERFVFVDHDALRVLALSASAHSALMHDAQRVS